MSLTFGFNGDLNNNMENNKTIRRTHGLTSHPIYHVWRNLISRCYNPKNIGYKYYGDRGIMVCQEWRSTPKSFIEWAEANGWQKGLQLDRIENDKGYSPNNCQFTTGSKNRLNGRLLQINNTSGFRGVAWHKGNKSYRITITVEGYTHYLGQRDTATEAAKARDAFVIKHNVCTPLNFPIKRTNLTHQGGTP